MHNKSLVIWNKEFECFPIKAIATVKPPKPKEGEGGSVDGQCDQLLNSLKLTAKAPENRYTPGKKEIPSLETIIFRDELLVWGRIFLLETIIFRDELLVWGSVTLLELASNNRREGSLFTGAKANSNFQDGAQASDPDGIGNNQAFTEGAHMALTRWLSSTILEGIGSKVLGIQERQQNLGYDYIMFPGHNHL